MANKQIWLMLFMLLVISNLVYANGLSVTLKRTEPGIVSVKPSEIIFDIVNTDIDTRIEGFILCRASDDVSISSTLGLASGSGAQYISPKFEMNEGPSQKSVYFLVESNIEGDYNTNCILKYIPFRIDEDQKTYVKMNLDETNTPKNQDYRELRLDKNVPIIGFAEEYFSAYCPSGKSTCRTNEVIIAKYQKSNNLYLYLTIILLLTAIIMLIILLNRRKH